MSEYVIVIVPCPLDVIEDLAQKVFDQKLAACVHIKQPHTTMYRWGWENESQRHQEAELVMKLPRSHYKRLEEFILKIHPFKCPSILAIPIIEGYREYFKWMDEAMK